MPINEFGEFIRSMPAPETPPEVKFLRIYSELSGIEKIENEDTFESVTSTLGVLEKLIDESNIENVTDPDTGEVINVSDFVEKIKVILGQFQGE